MRLLLLGCYCYYRFCLGMPNFVGKFLYLNEFLFYFFQLFYCCNLCFSLVFKCLKITFKFLIYLKNRSHEKKKNKTLFSVVQVHTTISLINCNSFLYVYRFRFIKIYKKNSRAHQFFRIVLRCFV